MHYPITKWSLKSQKIYYILESNQVFILIYHFFNFNFHLFYRSLNSNYHISSSYPKTSVSAMTKTPQYNSRTIITILYKIFHKSCTYFCFILFFLYKTFVSYQYTIWLLILTYTLSLLSVNYNIPMLLFLYLCLMTT